MRLIPDAWCYNEEDNQCCYSTRRRSARHGPVTNILLWLDCFSTLATVLVSKYVDMAAELWAYQRTIIIAQRDSEGEAWVTYDSCYRRQAAAKKSLDWSCLDFGLYNQAFAGRAKVKNRCRFCLSEFHFSSEFSLAPELHRNRQLPKADRFNSSSTRFARSAGTTTCQAANSVEICQLFNNEKGNMCRYNGCRFAHICSNRGCHGPHPRIECVGQKVDTRKRPRSPVRPPYPT